MNKVVGSTDSLDSFVYDYLFDNYPLDPSNDDMIVFETINDDLLTYVNYLLRRTSNVDERFIEFVTRNLFEISIMGEKEYNLTEKEIKKYTRMTKKLVKDFTDKWFKKWLVRSEVFFDKQELCDEESEKIESPYIEFDFSDVLSDDVIDEIYDYTEDALIENGEICFIRSVAEDIIVGCLDRYTTEKDDISTPVGKMNVLGIISMEIRKMSDSDRKSVYVLIDTSKNSQLA